MKNLNSIKSLLLMSSMALVSNGAWAGVSCNSLNPRTASTTPASHFSIQDDGTAVHNSTNLMWSRCPVGQSVGPGGICLGAASLYHWQGALNYAQQSEFAGYSDWRLPNIKELESIIERQCFSPAFNTKVFGEPSHWGFWSATPAGSNRSMLLNTHEGHVSTSSRTGATAGIYLVRDVN